MATATQMPHRRSKIMGRRRHVDDEADDHLDVEDDSVSDGSVASDDHDDADDSDSSNVDEPLPTTPTPRKPQAAAIPSLAAKPLDTSLMLQGIPVEDRVKEVDYTEVASDATDEPVSLGRRGVPAAKSPIIVSSDMGPGEAVGDRKRREPDAGRKRREEDPSSVPTRGLFFMHDQRPTGPVRGYGRGHGRGGRGMGMYTPSIRPQHNDPTTSSQWTHDLHDSVADAPARYQRGAHSHHPPRYSRPPANSGGGSIPTCPSSSTPIDRTMSTTNISLRKVVVRVLLPAAGISEPRTFPNVVMAQYTKLPDHRPPLRRDKPVRISLPNAPPRLIYPAEDRSFIFIPRAMRPNQQHQQQHQQQRVRGKPQSRLGSIGGWSRRTSVFGGSFQGSVYSPSVGMSRRSSVAAHDTIDSFSPTGPGPRLSAGSGDIKPVVRLPPPALQPNAPQPALVRIGPSQQSPTSHGPSQSTLARPPQQSQQPEIQAQIQTTPALAAPPPPIQQPRPYKATTMPTGTESSDDSASQAYQQAFHQQVPVSVSAALEFSSDHAHSRKASYAASMHGHSTGTPLQQIPERAIHAPPFQPTAPSYGSGFAYPQYGIMQPQGFYYPQPQFAVAPPITSTGPPPSATAPAFVPGVAPVATSSYSVPPAQSDMQPIGSGHIQQEINGMVYYFDASSMPHVQQTQHQQTQQQHTQQQHMQQQQVNPYPAVAYGHTAQGYGAVPMHGAASFFYQPHEAAAGMGFFAQ